MKIENKKISLPGFCQVRALHGCGCTDNNEQIQFGCFFNAARNKMTDRVGKQMWKERNEKTVSRPIAIIWVLHSTIRFDWRACNVLLPS